MKPHDEENMERGTWVCPGRGAGFDGVMTLFFGEGQEKNSAGLQDPGNGRGMKTLDRMIAIFNENKFIPCAGCGSCVNACPSGIDIPRLFGRLNAQKLLNGENENSSNVDAVESLDAFRCVNCGSCERVCPQFLDIRLLVRGAVQKRRSK